MVTVTMVMVTITMVMVRVTMGMVIVTMVIVTITMAIVHSFPSLRNCLLRDYYDVRIRNLELCYCWRPPIP